MNWLGAKTDCIERRKVDGMPRLFVDQKESDSSVLNDLVAQFVAVIALTREVFRQQGSGAINRGEKSFSKFVLLEMSAQGGGHVVPKRLPAFGMDGAVTNNGKGVRLGCDEEENGIAFAGVGHA